MLSWLLAALAGLVAAAAGYAGAPWRARLAPLAALLRAVAVLLLVALLLDAPAGRARAPRRFVALDASASWTRAGDSASWDRARAAAAAIAADSTFLFGDSLRAAPPPARPVDLASRVRPAVERAVAAGRPLTVVTDGELDDPDALRLLPRGSELQIPERARRADAALATLTAPRAAVAGDTVEVRVGLVAAGATAPGELRLLVDSLPVGATALGPLPADGERELALRITVPRVDGPRVLRAVIAVPGDAEPANDTLAAALEISPAAGVVLVSTQPDPDVRQMLAVLRGTVSLPTRAYLRVAPGQWRVEGTLTPVTEAEVRQAVRVAPVAVVHGDTAVFGPPSRTMVGALLLVAPPPAGEDWYAVGAPPSPFAAALSGVRWDSLPPINAGAPPRGDFVVLEVRRGREAARQAVIAGSEQPRRLVVSGSGFWRWAFRPGPGGDAYAALWGSIFDWLAAGRRDVRAAVPEAGVLRAGEPVRWRRGAGADSLVSIVLRRRGAAGEDTLAVHFTEGEVEAVTPPLPAGVYDVRAPGGTSLLVVSASNELVPRRVALRAGPVGVGAPLPGTAPPLRGTVWAWILPVLLLCGEWLLRRRQGLR
jgi:hypothetical protein